MDVIMDLKIKELDEFKDELSELKANVLTDMKQDSTSSRMNSASHEQKVPILYEGELDRLKENSAS